MKSGEWGHGWGGPFKYSTEPWEIFESRHGHGGNGGGFPPSTTSCLVMYIWTFWDPYLLCPLPQAASIPRPGMFYPPQNGVNGTLISWATTSMWHYKCFLFNLQLTKFSFPVPKIKKRTRFYLSIFLSYISGFEKFSFFYFWDSTSFPFLFRSICKTVNL